MIVNYKNSEEDYKIGYEEFYKASRKKFLILFTYILTILYVFWIYHLNVISDFYKIETMDYLKGLSIVCVAFIFFNIFIKKSFIRTLDTKIKELIRLRPTMIGEKTIEIIDGILIHRTVNERIDYSAKCIDKLIEKDNRIILYVDKTNPLFIIPLDSFKDEKEKNEFLRLIHIEQLKGKKEKEKLKENKVRKKLNRKQKVAILLVLILILAGVILYPFYKKTQMNKLVGISNEFFKEYIKENEEFYNSKNMGAIYNPKETVIIAGDSKEFVSQVFFELIVEANGESEDTSGQYKMRIKKVNGQYELIDSGNLVSSDGLSLVNYSSQEKEKEDINETKEDISSESYKTKAGIYYTIGSMKIRLSYNKKKDFVDVPISYEYIDSNIDSEKRYLLKDNTYYITHKKTAFISTNQNDILITISNDKGKTWDKVVIENGYQGGDLFIGFTSQDVGYYAITTDVAMGKQNSYIYITKDGGKTWSEIGNTNGVYPHVITGVGFLDDKIGFIGFRYESNNNPIVYRTEDAGLTWEELSIKLPYEYASDYATPLSPSFDGEKGILPVKLRDNDTTINFVTKDKGLTWDYSE